MGDASTTAAVSFGSSGEAAAAAVAAEDRHEEVLLRHEGNGHGEGSGGGSVLSLNNSAEEDNKGGLNVEDGGDLSNNCGGNRWPRQETLALLKIRSDMDATFRDSSLKAPLWEEVSRKLAELGYKRSAKKCKEKFENVYKYHKRTKDGRTGKSEGKTYRFFDQLEAFDQNHHPPLPPPSSPPPPPPPPKVPHQTIIIPPISTNVSPNIFVTTNPTTHNITLLPPPPPPPPPPPTTTTTTNNSFPLSQTIITKSINNNNNNGIHFSSPTSSSTASDEEFQARHKRKRKWRDFIRRLTREVVRKQEEMQKRFLETVAKCEHERTAREEAWRLQEMARINREHEILLQERSAAAAKDAAVIAFLQKVSGVTHNLPVSIDNIVRDNNNNTSISISPPQPAALPPPQPQPTAAAPANTIRSLSTISSSSSSSRWPKAEVEALINLRTNLDLKYQDNVPKGPLWEEISAGMKRLGYERSAKRCKEKWENINKYFKKVKDNNKKRSEDSKTCPYFHKLDAIYREKSKSIDPKAHENGGILEKGTVQPPPLQPLFGMEPLMVQPERQWPLQEEEEEEYDQDDDEEEEEEDRETSSSTEVEEDHHDNDRHHDDRHNQGTGDHGSYGIVSNVQSSMDMVE